MKKRLTILLLLLFLCSCSSKMDIAINENMESEYGKELESSLLFDQEKSDENLTVKEIKDYDNKKLGEQEITVVFAVEDKTQEEKVKVTVKDTKAPEIKLKRESVEITAGDGFNPASNIESVKDPIDGDIKKSDNSKINKNGYIIVSDVDTKTVKDGYKVKVTAYDVNGNKAEKEYTVNVKAKPEESVNPPTANAGSGGYDSNSDPYQAEPYYVNGILLVNKKHPLPPSFGALDPTAAAALAQLQSAAQNAGHAIPTMSGFRTYDYQVTLYNRYVAQDGQAAADTYSARPGFSEHQTGLVFDVGAIDNNFGNTAAGRWLRDHCHEFGCIIRYPQGKENITGYMYEPWHIRYVGVSVAAEIYQRGITLEEYLGVY